MPADKDAPPVLDFSAFNINLEKPDMDQLDEMAKTVDSAYTQHGYCSLINHGIDLKVIKNAMDSSRKYFQHDNETKKRYLKPTDDVLAYGLNAAGMKFGSFGTARHMYRYHPKMEKNLNPTDIVPEFDATQKALYDELHKVCLRYSLIIAKALDIPAETLLTAFSKIGTLDNWAPLALIWYLPLKEDDDPVRFKAHKDVNVMTMLFTDSVGGLEYEDKDDVWRRIPTNPEALHVIAGLQLQYWSGGKWRAPLHRVIMPEPGSACSYRQSTFLSVVADNDYTVKSIDRNKRVEFLSRDYLRAGLAGLESFKFKEV